MTTDKKPVALLADILIRKGLENLVHSPGSRNAPIIIAFSGYSELKITTVFDERSAAFYALGMALASGKTVAIDCTSGTAPLNYAPAIAEAYYQHIPLLVLTADRSPQFIDIGDGQTIRQKEVFSNYIKQSYELPQSIDSVEDFAQAEEMINDAVNQTMSENRGPVQINIPLDEPLYRTTETFISGKTINLTQKAFDANLDISQIFTDQWKHSRKLMILAGQMNPDAELNEILINLTEKQQVVVLTETTSNQCHPDFIDGIDNTISAILPDETDDHQPDLLITIGGAVVSKMVKKFLREHPPKNHWHISASGEKMDTFFCLTGTIQSTPAETLKAMLSQPRTSENEFNKRWLDKKRVAIMKREKFINGSPYCDLTVFDQIIKALPPLTCLHLGNSTPVRYSQLFGSQPGLSYFSNRGVSGIDGQISTAAGFATCSPNINVLITGDLGFLYDSNGLMLLTHCPNLKIVVINNQGGGIFRFIPGPDTVHNFEQYFEAHHTFNMELLTKAFNVDYLYADSQQTVEEKVQDILNSKDLAQVLEIRTPAEKNAEVLRNYFNLLKNS